MTHDVHVRLRHIADGDWDGIAALEAAVYTPLGLSEGRTALESRARASPSTCFVLDCAEGPAGYLLALPYPPFESPDLARAEESAPAGAPGASAPPAFPSDNLHLHDLVVAEDFRGRGLARRLLRHLATTARAQTYEQISLVAVAGSETFWSAQGYRAHREIPLPGSYGTDAVYMSAAVPEGRRG
ncbi:GNAT family N-acetyltransferase [Streptomyces flavofungini]|uniref:GNAT family N-acetyltransferase n=1 Tax=Streptomyces flavofungini TaxID=68200 RepID=A0ABS0X700_9ACTN|nr:GNAT family N-acetyltransferase [Streptomyces flavofungini]MBJ3808980.1 GNAT family N-acetyltransferase [Streptomyces flavofungini]GHC67972.1 N-acetyltransferase [Streptomyces flavofungini]